MGPEFWVTIAAAFIGGGAIGSAGTLFAQWLLRSVDGSEGARRKLSSPEMDMLRADIHDISRHVHNLDARLDFQERLLGGSLVPAAQPERLPPREEREAPEPEDAS
jgi:hypothetical protein